MTTEEIDAEIQSREELIKTMVGTLYPSILMKEIDELEAKKTRLQLLSKLADLWEKFPMLRFGQLISNVMHPTDTDLFYIQDEKLLELMKEFGNNYGKLPSGV